MVKPQINVLLFLSFLLAGAILVPAAWSSENSWAAKGSMVNGFFSTDYVKADIYSSGEKQRRQGVSYNHGYFKPRSAKKQPNIRSYPGRFKRNSQGVVRHPVENRSEWDVSNILK